jgi:hypothetical protein
MSVFTVRLNTSVRTLYIRCHLLRGKECRGGGLLLTVNTLKYITFRQLLVGNNCLNCTFFNLLNYEGG